MKNTLKMAMLATLVITPAFADGQVATLRNMENPLYLPTEGEVYSKLGFGVMYKITDDNDAQHKLFHDGEEEFPIWRPTFELGYGITDRWAVHGQIGYTHNRDVHRYGFHLGRLGTTFRLVNFDGWVWDFYGDLHMGGIEKMKGSLVDNGAGLTFKYDNFSNGRWGYHVGTKFGKVWEKWTTSAYFELLRTHGNHNNEIDLSKAEVDVGQGTMMSVTSLGLPKKMSVDLKSTAEFDFGANAFYQVNDRWSFGLGLKYVFHAQNGLEKVHTKIESEQGQQLANQLLQNYKEMNDRFNEFAQSLTIAYQVSDSTQVSWFIENTLDDGQRLSASTSDFKIETALRLNVKF